MTYDSKLEPVDAAEDENTTGLAFSSKILLASDPASIGAESLRSLRGVILSQHVRDGRRALAVCGTSKDAGCSFIAANLAVGMAQVGVKTLLIDANLREPALDRYIVGGEGRVTLVDLLRDDQMPIGRAMQRVQSNLSMIFAGDANVEDLEKLGGGAFQSLMTSCVRDHELVIVDTPPANRYAECRRIASIARYAMIVACRRRSYVSDVRHLIEELTVERTKVVGTFLNDY